MHDLQQEWPAVGTVWEMDHSFVQADFDAFAKLSGDANPIHVDPAFSARTRFGKTVSHGMLLYTLFWGMLAKHLPQMRQGEQSLMFPNPTFTETPVQFRVEVTGHDPKAGTLDLVTVVTSPTVETITCQGTARLVLKQEAAA